MLNELWEYIVLVADNAGDLNMLKEESTQPHISKQGFSESLFVNLLLYFKWCHITKPKLFSFPYYTNSNEVSVKMRQWSIAGRLFVFSWISSFNIKHVSIKYNTSYFQIWTVLQIIYQIFKSEKFWHSDIDALIKYFYHFI